MVMEVHTLGTFEMLCAFDETEIWVLLDTPGNLGYCTSSYHTVGLFVGEPALVRVESQLQSLG